MNKGEIRTRILEQVDWQPDQSTAFKDKVDRLINRAYQQLSLEAPYLFFEDKATIITEPDIDYGSSTDDRLANVTTTFTEVGGERTVTEDYLLKRVYTTTDTGVTPWPSGTDADLNGRMVELTLPDGSIHRREILSSFASAVDGVTTQYLAITYPFNPPTSAKTGIKYRIYTPMYGLPADVVELRSARIWGDRHSELTVETQYDMERYDYVDYAGQQSGRPISLFRGPHKQIDAPTMAPEVSIQIIHDNSTAAWVGPLPQGTFEFCYTWAVGKLDKELGPHSGEGHPRWESAPSPISSVITVDDDKTYIKYRMPNPNKFMDFGLEQKADPDAEFAAGNELLRTPERAGHSGIATRVYIRRTNSTATTVGPTTGRRTLTVPVENSKAFHLLSGATQTGAGTIDREYKGEVPDYFLRLKETHGYQTVRFNPMPDARYVIDCRVLRRPAQLMDDTDAPRLHEEAIQALIEKSLIYFYELQGSLELSQNAERRYVDTLRTLTKRYALIPRIRPSKRFARVRRPVREVRVRFKE